MVNKAAFKRGKHYIQHPLKLVNTVSNDKQPTISLFSGIADFYGKWNLQNALAIQFKLYIKTHFSVINLFDQTCEAKKKTSNIHFSALHKQAEAKFIASPKCQPWRSRQHLLWTVLNHTKQTVKLNHLHHFSITICCVVQMCTDATWMRTKIYLSKSSQQHSIKHCISLILDKVLIKLPIFSVLYK